MKDEQIQKIIDNIETNKDIEKLLYLLIDISRDNGKQFIDIQDIRIILDELF